MVLLIDVVDVGADFVMLMLMLMLMIIEVILFSSFIVNVSSSSSCHPHHTLGGASFSSASPHRHRLLAHIIVNFSTCGDCPVMVVGLNTIARAISRPSHQRAPHRRIKLVRH